MSHCLFRLFLYNKNCFLFIFFWFIFCYLLSLKVIWKFRIIRFSNFFVHFKIGFIDNHFFNIGFHLSNNENVFLFSIIGVHISIYQIKFFHFDRFNFDLDFYFAVQIIILFFTLLYFNFLWRIYFSGFIVGQVWAFIASYLFLVCNYLAFCVLRIRLKFFAWCIFISQWSRCSRSSFILSFFKFKGAITYMW